MSCANYKISNPKVLLDLNLTHGFHTGFLPAAFCVFCFLPSSVLIGPFLGRRLPLADTKPTEGSHWPTQSWNAAALETTVDDAVGWQGRPRDCGTSENCKNVEVRQWDRLFGRCFEKLWVDKAKIQRVGSLTNRVETWQVALALWLFLLQSFDAIPPLCLECSLPRFASPQFCQLRKPHWLFSGVMATKEQEPAVNGHPGEESLGRAGSEGRGKVEPGLGGQGRPKNEGNAQNRPKSEPNCCLLENGKRCTKPASNASYRWELLQPLTGESPHFSTTLR